MNPTVGDDRSLTPSDPLRDVLASALGAPYELLRLIGRGGMGSVYLARERFIDRLVAVKVLPGDAAASSDARELFLREARTAARLTHPHIVPLFTFGQAGETLFYVMGYVDGESLEARLRRDGRLPADEATRIVSEIADALAYAHANGVVHRDLKPDNVLLERETGRALLADFGVAKTHAGGETLTRTGMIVGTPHYMSPEQAAGERSLDGRSDLYALGVIGYRMTTGRMPFEGDSLREVLAQHLTAAPAPLPADVPPALAGAISRALAKAPDERWPDARAMRAALGAEDDDDALPDDLLEVASMGLGATAVGLGALELSYFGAVTGLSGPHTALGFAVAGVLTILLPLLTLWHRARRGRQPFSRVLAISYRQPRWWTGWWPRFARRPGDVWDRLPAIVRYARAISTWEFIPAAAALNMLFLLDQERFINSTGLWSVVLGIFAAGTLPAAFVVRRTFRWAKEHHLSNRELRRLLSESTASRAFWSRPEIRKLIDDTRAAALASQGAIRSPDEQLRAMEDVARELPHAPEVLREAVAAGREAVAAIASCDAELARLDRDASPADQARIESAVQALGPADPGDGEAKRRLRDVLDAQLVLVRSLSERRREVMERRQRLVAHLHALWLQVANLRAQVARVDDDPEITGRIRALERELAYEVAAVSEVQAQ